MQFRTPILPQQFPFKISHRSKIISLGSCFADTIGEKLKGNKFETLVNPYGNIFNPISIFKLFNIDDLIHTDNFVCRADVWYNYHLHSEIYAISKENLIEKIEHTHEKVYDFLKTTDVLILTFGTAFVYQLASNQQIVANCHKVSQSLFDKILLKNEELTCEFAKFYAFLKQIRPNSQIIVTVSPVRHIKDTLELNAVSKSILRLFCHEISSQYSNVHYFPAYELLLDDLRDYRFYAQDMIHPNETATAYIWDIFCQSLMENTTQKTVKDWENISNALQHRPFNTNSQDYQKFVNDTLLKVKAFASIFDVSEEISLLENKLV